MFTIYITSYHLHINTFQSHQAHYCIYQTVCLASMLLNTKANFTLRCILLFTPTLGPLISKCLNRHLTNLQVRGSVNIPLTYAYVFNFYIYQVTTFVMSNTCSVTSTDPLRILYGLHSKGMNHYTKQIN